MVKMKRYGKKFARRKKNESREREIIVIDDDDDDEESSESRRMKINVARASYIEISDEESDDHREIIEIEDDEFEVMTGMEIVVAENIIIHESTTIFTDRELKLIDGFEEGSDYIKIIVGCTNNKYGDFVGDLKIYSSGQFLIDCKCYPECIEANLTPDAFEKHSMREGTRKWQDHVWVILGDYKVPIRKTAALKYYKHASNVVNNSAIARRKRHVHRDEFMQCILCNSHKRFILRTQEQFRAYHMALSNKKWKCEDHPDGLTCSSRVRDCKKAYQVCPRTPTCKGCVKCVCMGCFTCRLRDCPCRDCVDFFNNAPPDLL